MDTLGFLRAVLPETGPYYLALFKDGHKAPAHVSYDTLEAMAKGVQKFDQHPELAVYHACASYVAPFVLIDGKKSYRKSLNWNRAKALWVDVDCGEDKAAEGRGYLNKGAAWQAVRTFCEATAFPLPMVVDSGNGLHCYWPLTKAIKPEAWQALAGRLRDVLAHFKVLVDPTCTADFARVLRPAGSTNRKRVAKSVKVVRETAPFTPEEIRDYLTNISNVFGVVGTKPPSSVAVSGTSNDDLSGGMYASMDSSAVLVAERCGQVALMRDTKGDVSYDHWRSVIGLIKHCTEGITLARDWTERRAETGHESVDVLTRYETWSAGPPTCEFFSKVTPGICDTCEHRGKIKSPIVLGRVVPHSEQELIEAVVDGRQTLVEIPKLPDHFKWENGALVRHIKDKDGIWHAHVFCHTLFYPIYRVHKENGSYSMGMRMHLPDGRVRQWDMDTGLLASPQKLMEELGHRAEIVQTNAKDSAMHMTAYLRESLEQLKAQAEEMNTMTTFGWKNDMQSFLVGDRLYHADGTVRKVLVGGYAADSVSHFPTPKGTVEGYAKALNHVYARKGMEALQYIVCSGFGSILTPFGENLYHGLLVAITGGDTAKGKTTACQAAQYAFGDAARMTIATDKGATSNALFAKMGTYGSLPILFDEYTNTEPKEFSDFAYRISQGFEKERLTIARGGVRKAESSSWEMSPFITANKDLHAILSVNSANSQAEAVRMIQIKIDDYDQHEFESGEVDSALSQMRINAGSAGEKFIQYVVTNRDEVFALFQNTLADIGPKIPGPKFRYYRQHAAASLSAAKLMKLLGIAAFDLDRLTAFTVSLMHKLVDSVAETNMITAEDALSYMINDLSPRIITTVEYRDSRDGRGPERVNRLYASVAGRYILGGADKKEPLAGKLYLVKKEMRDWCMKHRIELNAVLKYAKEKGVLVNENERFTVTRGTELATINLRCIALDANLLSDVIANPISLVVNPPPVAAPPVAVVK